MRLPLVLRGFCGAIAQLGERNTGSVEVVGSIPSGSTNIYIKFNYPVDACPPDDCRQSISPSI